MTTAEAISLILAGITFFSMFLNFSLGFYIIKTRIKEIDKAVQGYENPYHSIFMSMTM